MQGCIYSISFLITTSSRVGKQMNRRHLLGRDRRWVVGTQKRHSAAMDAIVQFNFPLPGAAVIVEKYVPTLLVCSKGKENDCSSQLYLNYSIIWTLVSLLEDRLLSTGQ